jgi:hypothetical protein
VNHDLSLKPGLPLRRARKPHPGADAPTLSAFAERVVVTVSRFPRAASRGEHQKSAPIQVTLAKAHVRTSFSARAERDRRGAARVRLQSAQAGAGRVNLFPLPPALP